MAKKNNYNLTTEYVGMKCKVGLTGKVAIRKA